MDKGFFGDLFDINHDGKLDSLERTMDFMVFSELMDEEERNELLDDEVLDSNDDIF